MDRWSEIQNPQDDIIKAISAALLTALQSFTGWLSDEATGGAEDVIGQLITWVLGANSFIVHTPLALVNVLSNVIGWAQVMPLVDACIRLCLVFTAFYYAGHHYFGWPGLGDQVQRIFSAVLLTRLSWQLLDWSLQEFDAAVNGLAVAIPNSPRLAGMNPIALVLLLGVWFVLLLMLALAAAERIVWLAVLKPLAPLAFLTWIHHKSAWIGSTYIRLWIGILIGQLFVVLAIMAMVLFINIGGAVGFLLSCGSLIMARKAIYILAPKSSEPLMSFGPIKIG